MPARDGRCHWCRASIRLNPGNTYNDTSDEDSAATHAELMRQAATLDLAYLHVMRAPTPQLDAFALARQHFGPRLILNDGFEPDNAEAALQDYAGAALSFARHFIGNPDLVNRLRAGQPLSRFDRKTLHAGRCGLYQLCPLQRRTCHCHRLMVPHAPGVVASGTLGLSTRCLHGSGFAIKSEAASAYHVSARA